MRAFQIILVTFIALTGCNKKAETAPATAADTAKTKTMATDSLTYLALGDSYTVGQSEPQSVSYPYQLVDSLNANGFKVAIPTVIATTGWTTDDLIYAISQSGITGKKYNFVTLLIGVNDQYQGLSIDNYKIKFAQVLNEAIAFAGGSPAKVFVLSIPDYGETPFAEGQDSTIYPQIMAFNAVNPSISQAAGVNYPARSPPTLHFLLLTDFITRAKCTRYG
jgi:lysophospholipase L1-like esterase